MSKEYADYFSSLRNYRDTNNQLSTKLQEGIEIGEKRGEKRGKIEIARGMKQDSISLKNIAKYTGLTIKEIESIVTKTCNDK